MLDFNSCYCQCRKSIKFRQAEKNPLPLEFRAWAQKNRYKVLMGYGQSLTIIVQPYWQMCLFSCVCLACRHKKKGRKSEVYDSVDLEVEMVEHRLPKPSILHTLHGELTVHSNRAHFMVVG